MRAPRLRSIKIATLAQRVQKQQNALAAQQLNIVRTWRQNPPTHLTSKQIDTLAHALSKHHGIKDLQRHESLLAMGIVNFALTPGFNILLSKLFEQANKKCPHHFKGTLYELTKALEIQRSGTGEHVEAFNQIIEEKTPQQGSLRREFDIVTNKRLIECKTVNWNTIAHTYAVRQQLLDQKQIALALQSRNKKDRMFQLCSRELIPWCWRNWLDTNGINYSW